MRTAALVLVATVASAALVPPAHARIICKGDFQLVNGSYISTPYCRDNYLAQVARQYGVKVSETAVRENPNLKKEVCRFVGRDTRVFENCLDQNSGRGGR